MHRNPREGSNPRRRVTDERAPSVPVEGRKVTPTSLEVRMAARLAERAAHIERLEAENEALRAQLAAMTITLGDAPEREAPVVESPAPTEQSGAV